MRSILRAVALAVLLCSAAAQAGAKVTLNFRDTDLLAVLDYYSKLTGMVFVPAENVAGRVTILSPGPVDEAQAINLLFTVLDMRGFAVVEVDGYYKVVEKSQAMEYPAARLSGAVPGDRLVTEVIKLDYVSVAEVKESLRSLISPRGRFIADDTLNFVVVTDTAASAQMLRKVVRDMDRPLTLPVTRSYRLQYVKVETVGALIESLLSGGGNSRPRVPPIPGRGGDGAKTGVLSDTRSNTLFVTAPEQEQKKVAGVLKELDIRSPQVLLEATLVEVVLGETNKLGVQWQFALSKSNPFAAISLNGADTTSNPIESDKLFGPKEGFNLAILNPGDYAAIIDLLSKDNNARVLSAPHVIASNNQEANLRIGNEIPILKELRLDTDNNPIRTFDRQKIGLEVKIKPSIAENRDVSLDLMIKVSSVRSSVVAVESGQITTSDREVASHVVVKDRQTLVIGGLMRDDVTDDSSGIPVLRELPGVGKLFGSEGTEREKTELLVLITPYVIETEAEADATADRELRRHPAAVDAGAIRQEPVEFDL